jgi:hypothetical protein
MLTLIMRPVGARAEDPADASYALSTDRGAYSASDEDTSDGQVLELPQVTDSAGSGDPEESTASADSSIDDDSAGVDGEAPGTAADYANRAAVAASMPAWPAASARFSFAPTLGRWSYAPIRPPAIIVVRPMSAGPLPSTSPMLSAPRGTHVVMGGWWQRAR